MTASIIFVIQAPLTPHRRLLFEACVLVLTQDLPVSILYGSKWCRVLTQKFSELIRNRVLIRTFRQEAPELATRPTVPMNVLEATLLFRLGFWPLRPENACAIL